MMSRAPGYLGNYEHRARGMAGLGSYGGMGQLQPATMQTLSLQKVQQPTMIAPSTITAVSTIDPTAAALNRKHVDQAKALYCSLIAKGQMSTDEASLIVHKTAMEKWGWTAVYARQVMVAASGEVARAATSDFAPWTGCPGPSIVDAGIRQPTETTGPPKRTAPRTAPQEDQPPPPPPPPAPPGPTPETRDAYGPPPPPATDIFPGGPPPPGVTFEPPTAPTSPSMPTAPALSTRGAIPSWALWVALGLVVIGGGYYLTTRRRPRANPRRRRRRKGARRRR
jgi:hypothetical protein